jgi:tartrate-resistant acid phosphatase type 5
MTFLSALRLATAWLLLGACQTPSRPGPLGGEPELERVPASPVLTRKPSGTGGEPPNGAASADRPPPPERVRVAAIGDYGWAGPAEQRVAELVDALRPDYVVTTGDNNYPSGEASTIDDNIGQYFSHLIYPYKGRYPSAATENRFFPTLGNHDWYTPGAEPYLEYFTLPGNERYYDVSWGPVHFFALDSDPNEPDGNHPESVQAAWLRQRLLASRQPFKVVAMHHPPYSSGPHGNTASMQWPFAEWGVDLVLAGHDHGYERLVVGGVTYVVSGLGGASIYSFGQGVPGSVVRYMSQYGAAVLDADARELSVSFFNVDGELVDSVTLPAR